MPHKWCHLLHGFLPRPATPFPFVPSGHSHGKLWPSPTLLHGHCSQEATVWCSQCTFVSASLPLPLKSLHGFLRGRVGVFYISKPVCSAWQPGDGPLSKARRTRCLKLSLETRPAKGTCVRLNTAVMGIREALRMPSPPCRPLQTSRPGHVAPEEANPGSQLLRRGSSLLLGCM